MKKAGIVFVSFLFLISVFGINPSSDDVIAKKELKTAIGDFEFFITNDDFPFITHSKETGITIYKMGYDEQTKRKKLILDENGNPIVCKDTDEDFVENLFAGFNNISVMEAPRLSHIKGTKKLYIFIQVDESPEFNTRLYVGNDEENVDNTLVEDILLTPIEQKYNGFEPFPPGSILLMDDSFNYMCYKYENDKLTLFEQKALHPDADYENYQTLYRQKTLGADYHSRDNDAFNGYLLLDRFDSSNKLDSKADAYYSRCLISASKTPVIDARFFIQSIHGVDTDDSKRGGPKKYSLHKLYKKDHRKIEYFKVQIEEESNIAIINDTEEYMLLEKVYDKSMTPVFDLCKIFRLKYHYRPFDKSILIERFK